MSDQYHRLTTSTRQIIAKIRQLIVLKAYQSSAIFSRAVMQGLLAVVPTPIHVQQPHDIIRRSHYNKVLFNVARELARLTAAAAVSSAIAHCARTQCQHSTLLAHKHAYAQQAD
jgi:hypothetical protein